MRDALQITWHGHSCFTLDSGGWILALDPYDSAMIGYPPLKIKAHAILCSHQHGDHNFRAAVQLLPADPALVLRRLPADPGAPTPAAPAAFEYLTVETCHDEDGGRKRGRNNVHVIRSNGLCVVHLGDLGHIPDSGQIAQIGRPDLLLVPVGGYYTIDAAAAFEVVQQLRPVNVAPMHYRGATGKLPIAGVEPFIRLMSGQWQINRLSGPSWDLDRQSKGQCCIFTDRTAE